MTLQDRMKDTLARSGIPAKEIRCYGTQVMITAWSRSTADRWANLLGKFAKVRAVAESRDDNLENRNTVLRPTSHRVWRVWATIR